MWSGTTIHPIFGVILALAGVALSVLAASVLYKDEEQKSASIENYQEVREERKAA